MNLNAAQSNAQIQFDKQSGKYGKSHILADTADLDATAAAVEFPTSGLALDVATGGGHTALWLVNRGLTVTATDLSKKMLENARMLANASGKSLVTRQHAAEELPYPDHTFDVVTCRVAAHHFSSPGDFVRESARVLKPGGWFLLIDGSVPDAELEAAVWMNRVEKLRDPSHGRLLPPGEWRTICESAHLRVVHCDVGRLSQPNLEWYFQTAATPQAERDEVVRMYDSAPDSIRSLYRLATKDGKRTWQWHRLQLVARAGEI